MAPIETRHAISDEDRASEQTLLATMKKRFAEFSGSRRDGYDLMTAQTPVAEGLFFEQVSQGVKGWWVRSPGASDHRAILYLHGGAYTLGTAKAYRGFASQLVVRAGVHAFVLDYPLAPENPFPAAYETALAARRWLRVQGVSEIALVGDSAGGGLALATLGETIANSPAVAAAVVFSPWTDLALNGASFNDPQTCDPIFQPGVVAAAAKAYLNGHDPKDGRASPLYRVPDVMPPLAIQVGTDELLLDDATRYGAFAAQKGGEVRLDIFEGMHHVFQRCTEQLSSARLAFDDAAHFLSRHWNGNVE